MDAFTTSHLRSSNFIDSDSEAVRDFARQASQEFLDDVGRVIALYRTVRDQIIYDPYVDLSDPRSYRASDVLKSGRGYCVGKASLLAAVVRAIGIPARVGYADVRNHMTSPQLYALIKGDIFRWHSYADIFLDGSWVKATPAFNASLCERLGLAVLEFDGRNDSLFQEFDRAGHRYMEYLQIRGTFADVPFERIVSDFHRHYPELMSGSGLEGDFQSEAGADQP